MAIIKCPECGHQISDKAPTCPSCGVEIKGNIIRCSVCGDIYFKEEEFCPNCHQPHHSIEDTHKPSYPSESHNEIPQERKQDQGQSQEAHNTQTTAPSTIPLRQQPANKQTLADNKRGKKSHSNTKEERKRNFTPLVVSMIITAIIAAVFFYFYKNANEKKELEAYQNVINSDDPMVMKKYLLDYTDAPSVHRDSVTAKLTILESVDEDWENAVQSKSKPTLLDYVNKHPDSAHKADALNMIDSIDWEQAINANSKDMYEQYISEHAYGKHADEAREKINKLKAATVQPDERSMIASLMRRFFLSINQHDENALTSTLHSQLSSFLGTNTPTQGEVVGWMNRQYREDVTEIVWRLSNDYTINKREVSTDTYEYTTHFTATVDTKRGDHVNTDRYRITAKVTPNGKISSMSMSKMEPAPKKDESADKEKQTEKPAEKAKASEKNKEKSAEKPKEKQAEKNKEKQAEKNKEKTTE